MMDKIKPGITLLGLGPGGGELLTRQAYAVLEQSREVYVRTIQHPAVRDFPTSVFIHSFDDLYERELSFEAVYHRIVETILELGRGPEGVVYAVPGHPFVAEATGPEIYRRAQLAGISVSIVEGLSFLEPTLSALGIDPFPQTVLIDALEVGGAFFPPFPPTSPALLSQVYSRQVASDVKLTLGALYPDQFPVMLIHGAAGDKADVEYLPLYAIDRSEKIGLLTSLYVPALGEATSVEAFQNIIAHLRDPQTGCPWDLKQTLKSMRPHLLEEAYEVLTALDTGDSAELSEELGDLMLIVLMLAQIAGEEGEFTMADVMHGIHTKLVRRHPHVFGDANLHDEQAVLANWEKLKAAERETNGEVQKGMLDGVTGGLPALHQAQEFQSRVARVGFDWQGPEPVWEKIREELDELAAENSLERREQELGDVLFSVVNLARHYNIEAETALREANNRFKRRFSHIERGALARGQNLSDMSLDEMEALWVDAKNSEDK